MSSTNEITDADLSAAVLPSRRALLLHAVGGAAAVATGLAMATAVRAQATSDADVLNFALNLEYLEAEFYTLATTGVTIDRAGIPVTGVGTAGNVIVKSNPQVNFTTPSLAGFARELAVDERAHVRFLRGALGSAAVARPTIDLRDSFNAAAAAAGIGSSFDPFASEANFLIASFIFEDLGVTAYKGAAGLISNKTFLEAAAGILAVEAYHAGSIRLRILQAGGQAQGLAQQVSDLRDAADGGGDKDQGVTLSGAANLVPTDADGIAFGRTTTEVLRIAYLQPSGAATGGGFFPNGLNGAIRNIA